MKTIKQFPALITFLLITAGFTSCIDDFYVEGNGIESSENRYVNNFDEVSSAGDYHVTVVPGDEYSLQISAESNLLPYIETDVYGKSLKIKTRGLRNLRNNIPIEVFITSPELSEIHLSGSGLIQTGDYTTTHARISVSGSGRIEANLIAQKVNADISGSGTIQLTGSANETEMNISGSGKILAYDLPHSYCKSHISGSGDIFVNVKDLLEANISGSGQVHYIDYPEVRSHYSGSGRVVDSN